VKSLLWVLLFVTGVTGVIVPLLYLYDAAGLPALDSEYAIDAQLKASVEGERRAGRAGTLVQTFGPIDWTRPDFNTLPRDLVALYISQWGCPSYFQTRREDPLKVAWRAFDYAMFNGSPAEANVRCEFVFAARIAQAMHISGGRAKLAIAAYRIRATLQKGDLVAYDLASAGYGPGLVGVKDAARALFKKKVTDMSLPQWAELSLAMPPNGMWNEVAACADRLRLKQARDYVLSQLSHDSLVTANQARLAQDQALLCSKQP
jgi:hypothetical protein